MASLTIKALRASLLSSAGVIEKTAPPGAGARYASMERFVLDLGQPFRSRLLTKQEKVTVDTAIEEYQSFRARFDHRECFSNSQQLVMCDDSKEMVYVEGFAWTAGLFPVLHGWIAIGGKVIDVTLPPETVDDVTLPEPRQVRGVFERRVYLGVPFRREYVRKRTLVTGGFGTLLDDWERGYPLLRDGGWGAVQGPGR